MEDELLPIDLEIAENSIIKVMGVGGGGCNAVNYLYRTGVEGVSFLEGLSLVYETVNDINFFLLGC